MPKKSASYDDFLSRQLREDPELVMQYLNEAYRTKDPHALFVAVRNVINAHEGMTQMEEKTGLKRQTLYKMLSDNGNPGWVSMCAVIDSLGLTLEFKMTRKTGKATPRKKAKRQIVGKSKTQTATVKKRHG